MTAFALAPPEPDGPVWDGAGNEEPQYGGTFVFHHTTNVRSLDPHTTFDTLSAMAIRLLYDGLLDYDENTNIVPSLAEAMPEQSEDGLRFRFRLREGVRFTNGRELTAEDVRWSMEHMLSPDVPSQGPTYYTQLLGVEEYRNREAEHVRGIRVIDERTIEFELTAPDQTFLAAMAMQFAYPVARENYERWGDVAVRTHPLGVGPYVLEEWERGVRLVFRKNEDYWRPGFPYVDRMVFLENLTRDVAVMRFRQGDIDAVHRFTPADYLYFRSAERWQPHVIRYPMVNLWGIALNTQMAPFENRHLRRAVAYALDREGWSRARNGRLRVTGQPIPPGLLGWDPEMPQQHYDLDRAREEMRLAGYPDGYPDEVTMFTSSSETARFYGELAQQDLARIGFDIRLNPLSFAAYLEETGKPRTAQCVITGWNMDYPDPANFTDSLFLGRSARDQNSTNRSFYQNPEFDDLVDRARVERDRERRSQMYREASQILIEDAPWAFMWNDSRMEATQPYVKNYLINRVFVQDYRNVWLDLPRRQIVRRSVREHVRMASLRLSRGF